jgi:hypothetical protein
MKERPPLPNKQAECDDEIALQHYVTLSESNYLQAPYYESFPSASHNYQHTGLPPDLRDPCDEVYSNTSGATNGSRAHPYDIPNVGIDSEKHPPWQPAVSFAIKNEETLPRSIDKHTEEPSQRGRAIKQSGGLALQYSSPPPPVSVFSSGRSPLMPTSDFAQNTVTEAARITTFKSFEGYFQDSESAKVFRKVETRGTRMPYRPPDSDSSIGDIERDRLYHVKRIYNAMTRGDRARDNEKSIAMKRWVHGAYYKSQLVEAYSHKVLDCLLEQAKKGYRGWDHNDYVADDRKGEDEDRDVDCAARLDNIILALEEEKTICEDVMNSACQIRMFVNAPRAYANRKYQNRVGNSKRGKPKDAEEYTNTKASKIRRTTLRPTTRVRTSSALMTSAISTYDKRKGCSSR